MHGDALLLYHLIFANVSVILVPFCGVCGPAKLKLGAGFKRKAPSIAECTELAFEVVRVGRVG